MSYNEKLRLALLNGNNTSPNYGTKESDICRKTHNILGGIKTDSTKLYNWEMVAKGLAYAYGDRSMDELKRAFLRYNTKSPK